MTDLGDRLMILLIAATSVLGLLIGFLAGFGEALVPEDQQWLFFVVLGLVFVAIVIGVWVELRRESDS